MKAFENTSIQSKIVYLFIFCLAGLFLAGSIVSAINELWSNQMIESVWGIRISTTVQMLFMFFMPAITLATWSGDKPFVSLGLKPSSSQLSLLFLAFIILVVSLPFISLTTQLNQLLALPQWMNGVELWMRNMENSAQKTTDFLLSGNTIFDYISNILFIGVVAAVAEEFFFRGALQQLLVKFFKNKHAGVWATAALFSVLHLQFYGFIPRLILGALLGYLFVWSRNLWVPIAVHFLNNALVITLNFFFKDNSVYQSLENPTINSTLLFSGFVSLILVTYLLIVFKTKSENNITTINTL